MALVRSSGVRLTCGSCSYKSLGALCSDCLTDVSRGLRALDGDIKVVSMRGCYEVYNLLYVLA